MTLACVTAVASLAGCASRAQTTPPPTVNPEASQPAPRATLAHRDGTDQDGSVLIVSRDIVAACPVMQDVQAAAPRLDAEVVWLVVLDSLAACMNQGGLRARRVSVSGGDWQRDVVEKVLFTRGVDLQRVSFVRAMTAGPRVEIKLLETSVAS